MIGWVIFRATSVSDALTMYQGMLGLNGLMPRLDFLANISAEHIVFLALAFMVAATERYFKEPAFEKLNVGADGTAVLDTSLGYSLAMTALMVLSIAKLSEQSFSPFLYFQF